MPCPEKPDKPTSIKSEHTEKGCVHYFDLSGNVNPKISSEKARPYIIISKDNYNSPRIIISPITDRTHCVENYKDTLKYPNNAPLYKTNNPFLDKDSVVLLDQVYTIDKDELCEEWYIGKVNNTEKIDKAIMYNYDLFDTIYELYKQLFEQLSTQVKSNYTSQYTRK